MRAQRTRHRRSHTARLRRLFFESLEHRLLLDAGPKILAISPTEVRNDVFDHLDVTFDNPVETSTFTPEDVTISGVSGTINITSVEPLDIDSFRVKFATLAMRGNYSVTIGPDIEDVEGNPMDQDGDGSSNARDDAFTTIVTYIFADVILDGPLTISGGDRNYDGQNILVDGTTVTIDGRHNFASLHLINDATLTHSVFGGNDAHKLDLAVTDQLIVDATSWVDATGKGRGTTGPGLAAGGSYGGLGGGRSPDPTYGDYRYPDDFGTGSETVYNVGGVGGGLIKISADTLVLDGQITANGNYHPEGYHGSPGGSGGGIIVEVGILSGTGSIHADGGMGVGRAGRGGGGGRVAVYAENFTDFDQYAITTLGGLSEQNEGGGAGSVYLRDTSEEIGRLIIDGTGGGAGWTALGLPKQDSFVANDEVVIRGEATHVRARHTDIHFSFTGPLTVTEHALAQFETLTTYALLNIENNSKLQVSKDLALHAEIAVTNGAQLEVMKTVTSTVPVTFDGPVVSIGRLEAPQLALINGATLTTAQLSALEITVGNLSIDATSWVDATGKGRGTTGPGLAAGGSYGGLGGGRSPDPTYGDYRYPDDFGTGSETVYNVGGVGGGLIKISADTLVLDGQITANGNYHPEGYHGSPGGSGGGIIVEVGILSGTGSIHADGGMGVGRAGRGGGGGRVAVYAEDFTDFDQDAITALGGLSEQNEGGGAGSVYLVLGMSPTFARSHSPGSHDSIRVNVLDHVVLEFNKEVDAAFFESSNLLIVGPSGRIPAELNMLEVGDRLYRIDFDPLVENGSYDFTLQPSTRDARGCELDQNANGLAGEPEDSYSFVIILDTISPRVSNHTPAGDITGTIEHVDVWFSEAVDVSTFGVDEVKVIRPDDETIAATSVQEVGLNRFRITFPGQTMEGLYRVVLDSTVRDLAGNQLDQDGDGQPGEEADDSYEATFNVVPVDLQISNVEVQPAELYAGEIANVSWSVVNSSGAALLGNWIDGVYLSVDDEWDITDARLAFVSHSGGLSEDELLTRSAFVELPGVLPGQYHIIVRADIANQQKEADGESNNIVSTDALQVDIPELTLNDLPVLDELHAEDSVDYFAIAASGGDAIGLILSGPHPERKVDVYASLGSIPTPQDYDYAVTTDLSNTERVLAFTAPLAGGTYYVLLRSSAGYAEVAYEISADTGPFFVTSISPDKAARQRSLPPSYREYAALPPTIVTIAGTGLSVDTEVEFIDSAGTIWLPETTHFSSTSSLLAKLNIADWPVDTYDVRITKGSFTHFSADSFAVLEAGQSQLEAELIVPNALGGHAGGTQTIWLKYANVGDAPMAAPLFRVTGDKGALLTADPDLSRTPFGDGDPIPSGISSSAELIGKGSGASPGILQPGDSLRLPIYYRGLAPPQNTTVTFELEILTADAISWQHTECHPSVGAGGGGHTSRKSIGSSCTTFGVDWSIGWNGPGVTHEGTLREDLRPEWMNAGPWAAIWANLQLQIGDEWGNYVEMIADNLNFLHSVGQERLEINDLWNYEVMQASAFLNPVGTLSSSVDASSVAPGLPLIFSRVYGQSIPSRFGQSTLGRGWSHNWDIFLEELTSGDVVLRGPGGSDCFFTRNADGTYSPLPGDNASLAVFDGKFRLTETGQTVWQFRVDKLLDYVQDANGNRITVEYMDGEVASVTHSNGDQLLFEYDANGNLSQVTDPVGSATDDDRITTYEYDLTGQYLLRVIAPGDRVTSYTYETEGTLQQRHALLAALYPDGRSDHFAYDGRGRLIETSNSSCSSCGETVSYTYDSAGGVIVTDATGNQTFLGYGVDGQIAHVRDGNGNIVDLDYNDEGQLAALLAPGGERYRYSYTAQGNLSRVTVPTGHENTFTYDAQFDQLTSVSDARSNEIEYTYDSTGNLASIIYEDGTHEDFTYDSAGNVLSWTNRRGQAVTHTYNAAGQLTSKDYPDTNGLVDFPYTYDDAGNLLSATDPNGTTSMHYDPLTDDLLRIDYPGGQYFAFAYDAVGRRTRRADQDGNVVNYIYDAAGRLNRLTDRIDSLIVDYDYDAVGRLAKKTLGNSVYTTYEYDASGNVLHLINFKPDDSVLSRFDYTYDVSGRRTSMTTLEGTRTYGYDALGQLTSVAYPDGRIVTYVYDPAGNRVEVIDDGVSTTYTSNDMNQYTSVGDVTYTFDADGNMISKTEDGVTTTYTYDIENRLVEMATPTDTWVYSYDALGNRVKSSHNGEATNYVVDPAAIGNVAAEYDGSEMLIASYDHGLGMVSRTDSSGGLAYYTFSTMGDTSEITDSAGKAMNTYSYDAFGGLLSKLETTPNVFTFAGEVGVASDPHGLQYMRARDYDTTVGRFVQPDPIGIAGGINLYTYTTNSPPSLVDPTGKKGQKGWCGTENFPMPDVVGYIDLTQSCKLHDKLWDTCGFPKSLADSLFAADIVRRYPTPDGALVAGIASGIVNSPWGYKAYNDAQEKCNKDSSESINDPERPGDDTSFGGTTVNAIDPNDKLAPAGAGGQGYVVADTVLPYQIRFENKPDATAPAQKVIVTDVLDEDLDLSTFELTEITFADYTLSIPPGLNQYETSFLADANGTEILIDVRAGLDLDTRELNLVLEAIDPLTGWMPESPLIGLLYPNDETRRGEGSISYLVYPKDGLASGTEIHNRASIVFDFNDPILTPQVLNTIDAGAPQSSITPLPATLSQSTFLLEWSGQDDLGGSGIASYDVYFAVDDSPFVLLLEDTTDTSATIEADSGHTYHFYGIAKDLVGHIESAPETPDASIIVEYWHNGRQPCDVNNDTFISPVDALIVISRLNTVGASELPAEATGPPVFYDVSNDGFISPIDALLVIAYLNTERDGEAEGEAPFRDGTLPTTTAVETPLLIAPPVNLSAAVAVPEGKAATELESAPPEEIFPPLYPGLPKDEYPTPSLTRPTEDETEELWQGDLFDSGGDLEDVLEVLADDQL